MPVLDACFLIDVARRLPQARALHGELESEGEALVVPLQVAVEFATGERDEHEVFRVLREGYELHMPDQETGTLAAALAREAFRGGAFPGWPDVQVAATAVQLGMEVVTRNVAHFEAMGVRTRDYPTPGTP